MFVTDIVHCDSDISIGCDTPPNLCSHNNILVLCSVRLFFSLAHHTPLTLFLKILRVLSSVRHFFSVAHHTPLTFFHTMLRTFTTEAPFFSVALLSVLVLSVPKRAKPPPPFFWFYKTVFFTVTVTRKKKWVVTCQKKAPTCQKKAPLITVKI